MGSREAYFKVSLLTISRHADSSVDFGNAMETGKSGHRSEEEQKKGDTVPCHLDYAFCPL